MKRLRLLVSPLALLAAMSSGGAQQLPPIRPLGAVMATAADTFRMVAALRHLPGGRVLVNDPGGRRVVMYDSLLANPVVIADSTSATANAYSGRMGGLVPYRGDSTLFVDPTSMSMLLLDPAAKVARVMSVPRSQDAMFLAANAFGTPGVDAKGRIVYRGNNFVFRRPGPNASGGPMMPEQPDSAPILRIDLATRQLDTAAFVKIQKVKMNMTQEGEGRFRVTTQVNPLPVVDEWTVLEDGTIAIVRGRDYHVDWVNPDGSLTSSPKIPFEWQRLTDEDKVAFIDSVKAQRERMGAPVPGMGNTVVTSSSSDGGGRQMVVMAGPGGASPPPRGREGQPGNAQGAAREAAAASMSQLEFVSPSDLPDYKPAFLPGAVKSDPDGNLWIRTVPTKKIPGGPVYDVVNRKGELIDRVQVPEGRMIVGFGAGGSVYLASGTAGSFVLERAVRR